jgi:hypothetical protein
MPTYGSRARGGAPGAPKSGATFWLVPETKGVTLEQIERNLMPRQGTARDRPLSRGKPRNGSWQAGLGP